METEDTRQKIEELLENNCARFSLTKYGVNGKGKNEKGIKTIVFAFKIKVIHEERARDIVNELSKMEGVYNIRINFRDADEKI